MTQTPAPRLSPRDLLLVGMLILVAASATGIALLLFLTAACAGTADLAGLR